MFRSGLHGIFQLPLGHALSLSKGKQTKIQVQGLPEWPCGLVTSLNSSRKQVTVVPSHRIAEKITQKYGQEALGPHE